MSYIHNYKNIDMFLENYSMISKFDFMLKHIGICIFSDLVYFQYFYLKIKKLLITFFIVTY